MDGVRELEELIDDREGVRDAYRLDAWPLAIKRARVGLAAPRPAAVAKPRSSAEVARVLRWAGKRRLPVIPWGAGSSVTGAALPSADAVVMDMRGLCRIGEIDAVDGRVTVEAGVLGGELERVLAQHGWTTWFSPQSLHRSTVGGWVATRATGQFSSRWGAIEDTVAALTVVLSDGTIVRAGTPPRGAVGPDLKSLFIGSEGCLGVVTEVVLRIHPSTTLSGVEALALPGVEAGLAVLRELMLVGLRPALLRLYDSDEARYLRGDPPATGAVLLVGFAGHPEVAAAERQVASGIIARRGGISLGSKAGDAWLASRYDFSQIEGLLAEDGGYAETIEVAHGWGGILRTYQRMKRALEPVAEDVLGHFSHAYTDGTSLYLTCIGRAKDDPDAVRCLEEIWERAMRTALETGAVISHHHGVGRARVTYLGSQLGEGAAVLTALKRALDPDSLLNPPGLAAVAQSA